MPAPKNLNEALLAFQSEAPALQKRSINPHFKSKYVSLDSLMDEVLPLLNKHGLVVTQMPTHLPESLVPALRTRLVHATTGEALEDTMLLLPLKPDPQSQGSALTYARRYALMSMLGLVADVDDDGAAARRSQGPRREETARPPQQRPAAGAARKDAGESPAAQPFTAPAGAVPEALEPPIPDDRNSTKHRTKLFAVVGELDKVKPLGDEAKWTESLRVHILEKYSATSTKELSVREIGETIEHFEGLLHADVEWVA